MTELRELGRRCCWTLLVTLAVVGCSAGADAGSDGSDEATVVRDSAGITIVENVDKAS